jgi:hypothetical protein
MVIITELKARGLAIPQASEGSEVASLPTVIASVEVVGNLMFLVANGVLNLPASRVGFGLATRAAAVALLCVAPLLGWILAIRQSRAARAFWISYFTLRLGIGCALLIFTPLAPAAFALFPWFFIWPLLCIVFWLGSVSSQRPLRR